MILLTLSQFAVPVTSQEKLLDSMFDTALGPYVGPFESFQEAHDFQTAYGIPPGDVWTGPDGSYPLMKHIV